MIRDLVRKPESTNELLGSAFSLKLIGALAAAVPGLIDLLYYKGRAPRGKKIALRHMTINLAFVVLCAVNIRLRTSGQESMKVPLSFRSSAYA